MKKEDALTWNDIKLIDRICDAMKSDPKWAVHLLEDGQAFYEEALILYNKHKRYEQRTEIQ